MSEWRRPGVLSSEPAPHTLDRPPWNGALARIQTLDLLGHYSRCSIGLSYERVRRENGLEPLAIHRLDPDRHCLVGVRGIAFDDELVLDSSRGQSLRKRAQVGFAFRVKGDSVGAVWNWFGSGVTGSMDELGGLGTDWDVGADDAVVRQVRRVNDSWGKYMPAELNCNRGTDQLKAGT